MTTVVIRANYMDASIERLITSISKCGIKIIIAADFTNGKFNVDAAEHFEINLELFKTMGLFIGIPQPMWQCGDYALYAALTHTNSERLWLIESDIRLPPRQIEQIFSRAAQSDKDCLLARYIKSNPEWHWYNSMSIADIPVYRCQFPIVYARRNVIEEAYRRRVRLSSNMPDTMLRVRTEWPNDEAFFASAINAAGFSVGDFRDAGISYTSQTFRYEPPFLQQDYEKISDETNIYHPVLEIRPYITKLMRNSIFARSDELRIAEIERLRENGVDEAAFDLFNLHQKHLKK